MQSIPALSKRQPDVASLATGLSERDVYLIRSIEWLTMNPETMPDALVCANAVARYFLGMPNFLLLTSSGVDGLLAALGQAGAAQNLLKTVPHNLALASRSNIADEPDRNGSALEHEQFKQLFAVFTCHELVDEVLTRVPKAT